MAQNEPGSYVSVLFTEARLPRAINRLTTKGVEALKEPGLYADGAGLYLRIDQTLNRRWVFIFPWRGRRREMGLGAESSTNGVRAARQAAAAARQQLAEGIDPIAARKTAGIVEPTFGEMALQAIEAKKPRWTTEKQAKIWERSLEIYCAKIWAEPVSKIGVEAVLRALRPIVVSKPVTAKKVRLRVEYVLDFAKAEGWRTGENPARWRGHLEILLVPPAATVKHHAALARDKLPGFMVDLRGRVATSARALEWTILAAARTGDTIYAKPEELQDDVWVIPAARYKTRREHRVPITGRMRELAEEMRPLWTPGGYLFPGDQRGEPLSYMAMLMLLRRMGVTVTVHGFRSTFRDWAGDRTAFPREVIEQALGHAVGDAVERAYRRGDALEKRRLLMEQWETFATTPPNANVLPFEKPA